MADEEGFLLALLDWLDAQGMLQDTEETTEQLLNRFNDAQR